MKFDFFSAMKKFANKKFIYFGTGSSCEALYTSLPFEAVYFVDNDLQKWDKKFKGLPIYSPEKLIKENKEEIIIIVASQFWEEIVNQLNNMGFTEDDNYFKGYQLLGYVNGDTTGQAIYLDYPVNSLPRYGYGKPPHKKLYDLINRQREQYANLLKGFVKYSHWLKAIPIQPVDDVSIPYWNNGWLPGLDALTIYCLIANEKPKRYFEIGSGNSTKFARYAVKSQKLNTEMVSIDPCPRAEIDIICDKVYRQPVEDIDTEIFAQLQAGDILFIDNSHRCFMNSDVTTVFLDIIPYLNKGVLIGIHDIFLPYDYPSEWIDRYYSEQYLLASYLLGKANSADIVLPNGFVSLDSELVQILSPVWEELNSQDILRGGGIFWLRV